MLKNILIQSADIVGVRITVEGGGFVQLQMLLLHQDFDFGKLLPVHILYQGRMLRFLEEGTEISRRNPQIARYLFLGDGLVDVEADIVLGLWTSSLPHCRKKTADWEWTCALRPREPLRR